MHARPLPDKEKRAAVAFCDVLWSTYLHGVTAAVVDPVFRVELLEHKHNALWGLLRWEVQPYAAAVPEVCLHSLVINLRQQYRRFISDSYAR
jgi:hypothetical protein